MKPVVKPTEPAKNDAPATKATNYTVKAGDTLSGICGRFGVKMDNVCRWNDIKNPNLIRVGQYLIMNGLNVTASALNVRKTPNGTIIDVIKNGKGVEKIGTDGKWINVKYNGKTGWCHSDYLK